MTPQVRHDPITARPVLIAPERAARVGAMLAGAEFADDAKDCPFCEQREGQTPPELYAMRAAGSPANGPGWRVRIVPNRYPAVRDGSGEHELIIECPQHEPSLAALTCDQLAAVLQAVLQRMSVLRQTGRWACAQWFKNHGSAAGASLSHAHSQLIALPELPPNLAAELKAMRPGHCPFCTMIERELADGTRVVRFSDRLVMLSAFAGRFPFETWLLPRQHELLFDDISPVAVELHWLLNAVDAALDRPAYNLILHAAPWNGQDFHWHFELLPRVTGIAGFELGAGMHINPVLPEDAAERLRRQSLPLH